MLNPTVSWRVKLTLRFPADPYSWKFLAYYRRWAEVTNHGRGWNTRGGMGSPGSVSTFTQFYDDEILLRSLYSRVQKYQNYRVQAHLESAETLQTPGLTSSSQ